MHVKPIEIRFTVREGEEGQTTLQEYLLNHRLLSRTHLIQLKQAKAIFLNGRYQYSNTMVHTGDEIHFFIEEEESENILPQVHPLNILYEDVDILVVEKEAGICVHPTMLHPDQTLANYVVAYWQAQGEAHRFRAVNRLDKDTSGLLVIAKHRWAHQQLSEQQKRKQMLRIYRAWLMGGGLPPTGTIDAPIARVVDSIMLRHISEEGQVAITHFEVLKEYEEATQVECRLETGRTHQIRVHFSHLGHPLWGDDLYGGSRVLIGRQALHAVTLGFYHPRTREWIQFEAALPQDLRKLDQQLSE